MTKLTSRNLVIIGLLLTLAVNAPTLVVHTMFYDDWAWFWTYRTQGSTGVQSFMWQDAHPGYGPVMNLIFAIGHGEPGRLARLVGLAFHLSAGWLVFQIFVRARTPPRFAVLVALLYLLSPYLTVRISLSHTAYDISIFFYLLSILLSTSRTIVAFVLAIPALVVGFSVDSLIAFEPLRWWLLYRRDSSIASVARRALPFAVLVLGFVALRATWLVPFGHYTGANSIHPMGLLEFSKRLFLSLAHYVTALYPLVFLAGRKTFDVMVELSLLVVAIIIARSFSGHSIGQDADEHAFSKKDRAGLLAVASIILIAGTLPYIAVGRIADFRLFSSRFAVAAQMGALIIIATCLFSLANVRLRVTVIAGCIFLFSAIQLISAKWALYDELVMNDFQSDVEHQLASNPESNLLVQFEPLARNMLLRRRCPTRDDTNVPLEIGGKRNGGMAFDRDCIPSGFRSGTLCRINSLHYTACSSQDVSAVYRVHPGMERFATFSLLDLSMRVAKRDPVDMGTLTVQGPVQDGK